MSKTLDIIEQVKTSLYHWTTPKALGQILSSNSIGREGKTTSFTRDANYIAGNRAKGLGTTMMAHTIPIGIELDHEKLKQDHKITPHVNLKSWGDLKPKSPEEAGYEQEETAHGKINDLHKYIKRVIVHKAHIDDGGFLSKNPTKNYADHHYLTDDEKKIVLNHPKLHVVTSMTGHVE
jgi:hypothetical protein